MKFALSMLERYHFAVVTLPEEEAKAIDGMWRASQSFFSMSSAEKRAAGGEAVRIDQVNVSFSDACMSSWPQL